MQSLQVVLAIVRKDLRRELRTKEVVLSTFVFAVLVLVIFNFTLPASRDTVLELAPGILWVAFTFSGVLGLDRTFASEKENRSLDGLMLAPVDRSAIYFGKLASNLVLMLLSDALLLPLFGILYNFNMATELPFPAFMTFLLVVLLGTLAYAAVGTILAAIAANTTMREVLLPLLLFPIAVPVVIGAAESTRILFQQDPLASPWPWIRVLAVFALVFIVLAWLTFEYVLEE